MPDGQQLICVDQKNMDFVKNLIAVLRIYAAMIVATAVLLILLSCNEEPLNRRLTPITKAFGAVMDWSPDGQWIAIGWFGDPIAVSRGIYLVRPDGSDLQYFFAFDEPISILDICWSPDGKWLAFVASQQYITNEVFKIKVTGDSLIRLTFTGDNYECDWANSDTLMAYEYAGRINAGIWLMDKNGMNSKFFIAHGAYLDFALNDSLIYIRSINSDTAIMGIMNTSDSGGRIIYRWKIGVPYTIYADPAASPTASEIALEINGQIWKMNLSGQDLAKLTVAGGGGPAWSPDGQYIVYNQPGGKPMGGTVWIMRADGTEYHILIDWNKVPAVSKVKSKHFN